MVITPSPLLQFAGAGVTDIAMRCNLWPLSISKLKAQDAKSIHQRMSLQTCQNLGIAQIKSVAQAKYFIAGSGATQQQRFAIRHNNLGLLGGMAYNRLSKSSVSDIAEISYWLAEPYRGRGVMKWALQSMLIRLKALGVSQVLAHVYAHNQASRGLLKRLGFTLCAGLSSDIVCYQAKLT
ncbi:GNAT family N-acetyltransferase [Pseudoalteromonas luteoviolacea]|uniref:N-acetyltransferase domain-containing protein n=1 Tax=Pseudoalteromonas luteoviolacea DSM 6061 TaxID=1365250 RepID=A0A166WX92_9GAMM|nr:GNAT family N-acetyltransferase [Pseudoalteromonas luteoviolacea]KZN38775.1 hypothetical protein N475_15365 [Pseudoalteromonas luteoviolacea DSM 6061]KZN53548.1 hypothetical protein N474_21040 [Pseudoalteromonas luteoviolacea CPMOR-2]MBE0387675.1 hypothetical protein [Pseudoalteromonas luteoviolacea DSM 6061]TQF72448.1 GNAT family N-acetyltransferase [Pseudoalteromonas luteoviolacea]